MARRTTRKMAGACIASLALLVACRNEIEEGCKYATGLDEQCNVIADGKWFAVPAGFPAVEISSSEALIALAGLPTAPGLPTPPSTPAPGVTTALHTETVASDPALRLTLTEAIQSELKDLTTPPVNDLARSTSDRILDGIETDLVNRYLLTYSNEGTKNDCLVSNPLIRKQAIALLTERNEAGAYKRLTIGARSKMSSKVFRSTFISAKLKAQVEADFSKIISDAAQAKAAADLAFSIMTTNVDNEFAAGFYRYLSITGHPQVWEDLKALGAVRNDCTERKVSVAVGFVIATLGSRDWLVQQATETSFDAQLKAQFNLPDDTIKKLKLATQAALSVEIKTSVQKTMQVSLDRPALMPLRWKAALMD